MARPTSLDRLAGLAGFRVALRKFLAASERISLAGGVTQQQYQALLAILTWADGAMTMKDLAQELLLTHHAAVQLVDRLARLDLVGRTPSTQDRRSVNLALTAEGRKLIEALAEQHLEELLRQEPQLSRSLRRLRGKAADASTGGTTVEANPAGR